jgi:hypothetical protein
MRTSRCILYTAVGTILCLFYVFQQTEIVKLGYKITAAEKILQAGLDRKTSLEFALSSLESPLSIDKNLFLRDQGFEMARDCKLVKVGPAAAVIKSAGAHPAQESSVFKRLACQFLFTSKQAEAKTVK